MGSDLQGPRAQGPVRVFIPWSPHWPHGAGDTLAASREYPRAEQHAGVSYPVGPSRCYWQGSTTNSVALQSIHCVPPSRRRTSWAPIRCGEPRSVRGNLVQIGADADRSERALPDTGVTQCRWLSICEHDELTASEAHHPIPEGLSQVQGQGAQCVVVLGYFH